MLPGLLRQDGFDYSAIEVVFNTYKITNEKREFLFRQIVEVVDIIDKERQQRRKNAG